ncbi:MAG: hypothetical protein JWQ96_79 [Segetibacter sp.]|jgi:hypothetical protein|nr:hypothetical protein [Segetibacter sp.]
MKTEKMKLVFQGILLLLASISGFAQEEKEEEPKHSFKKENIFVGGGIGLGVGGFSGGFNIGANPEVGYSIANWIDAGISTNINYFSYRAEVNNGIRQRSTNYGVGVFTRIYPFRGFFLQVLPEYNWINTNLKDERQFGSGETLKIKQEAPSFLLGAGYGSRMIGDMNFFTVIMVDMGNNSNSPYIDTYGSKLPILRTGFNFYLKPKRR